MRDKYVAPSRQKSRRPKKNRRLMVFCIMLAVLLASTYGVMNWLPALGSEKKLVSDPSASSNAIAPSTTPENASATAPSSLFVPAAVGPFDEEGIPLLCNRANPLPEGYVPELTGIGNGYMLHPSAASAYAAMVQAAQDEGTPLWCISGYRSNQTQRSNYEAKIAEHMRAGYSREEAEERTARYIAVPGTSEHEAGLAVDLNLLEDRFDQTPAYQWMEKNCARFGFIRRYQKTTEEITKIAYEPWHFRYVGTNHAAAIEEKGITLEEYVALMNGAA